jgi:cellulose synthase/poly-beta-1,6-N-acetylglucosamine synthase-like glycosyltransferase
MASVRQTEQIKMAVLFAFCSIVCFLYIILIFGFRTGWNNYPEYNTDLQPEKKVSVSVIIAFRNELPHLRFLLEDLGKQELDSELFEVILCDDASDDGSGELAALYCLNRIRYTYCRCEGEGKKNAVGTGIKASINDIIVLTDADCRVGSKWLSTIVSFYESHNPGMVIGLVDTCKGQGFAGSLLNMEFLSLTGSGAAAAINGNPLFCSGANLSYRKSMFSRYGDPLFDKVVSGDDTFFMHRIKKNLESGSVGDEKIMVLKSRSSVVTTKPVRNFREFMDQRSRWSSKSIRYKDRDTVFTALLVYVFNSIIIISAAFAFTSVAYIWFFFLLLLLKAFTDYLFLKDVMLFFGKKIHLPVFAAGELIYPFYAVLIPLKALASGFKWKGRKY